MDDNITGSGVATGVTSASGLLKLGFSGSGIEKGSTFGGLSSSNQYSAGIEKGGISGSGQITGEEF